MHFDRGTFERLVGGTPEPLESRFEITHGVLLSCLQGGRDAEPGARKPRGGGYRRLLSIIARSHGGPRQQREQRRRAAACFRTLRHAGIVDVVPFEAVRGRVVEVSGDAAARFLAAPHAVAVPGRCARRASIATRRPTRWTC